MEGREYKRYLIIAVFAYTIFFSVYSLVRHYAYITNAYDLGIFMQSLWTTAHGNGFFNTPEWEDLSVYSHFGVHNSPILFLLVPVYRLLPYAETLLIIQTIALGAGAFTLFKFAKEIIGERNAFYLSLMYLTNPLIQGINQFDFHPVSLVVPLIFLIPHYYEKKDYTKMIIVSIFTLMAKEDSGLILISLGAFFLVRGYRIHRIINLKEIPTLIKESKWESLLIVMGTLWISISLLVVIPHYNHGAYPYFSNSPVQRYSFSISYLHIGHIVAFSLISLLTLMFIPLLNLEYFATSLPLWLELLLPAKTPNMVTIGYQYPYMLMPFLFILSTYILSQNKTKIVVEQSKGSLAHKKAIPVTIRKAAVASLVFMILFSPAFHIIQSPYISGVPVYKLENLYEKWTPYFQVITNVTTLLSKSSCPVTTQGRVFPHLDNRKDTYVLRTCFKSEYLPNNSIVLLARSLPDYNFTVKALKNSTLTANKTYFVLDVNTLILDCYNQTGNNTKEFKACIINSTERITHECEQAKYHERKG